MPEMSMYIERRFWSFVNQHSGSECWLWHGCMTNGYGQMSVCGTMYYAHRLSYCIHFKDPGELETCHECNNKLCVNPNHLFLGTHQENVQHGFDTGRSSKGILNACAKLSESDVREIRQLQDLVPQTQIAKMYNVSQTTIHYIFTGKTWTHVA